MKKIELFIKQLQEKPIRQRKMIALGSTVLVTAVIFVIWLGTFSGSVNSEDQEVARTTVSPAGALKNNVGLVITGLRDFFGAAKTGFQKTKQPGAAGADQLEPVDRNSASY